MIKRVEKTVEIKKDDGTIQKIDIYVQRPSNKVAKQADRQKSKVWNECLMDNILTKKELEVVLEKRGIWDEEKQKDEEKITEEIVSLEKFLYHGSKGEKLKLSQGRKVALEIRKLRVKLRDLITERIALEENTAESISDNARFDYLVAHCTFYANGKPVYRDFEDYDRRSSDEIAFAAATALGQMLYQLDNSFEKSLPENKFLLNYGLVNDELDLIDPEAGFFIDAEGKKIDEEGYYLDENNERVDVDGNKLTEDGYYEITAQYENDLVKKKPVKRKTKAQATKTES